MKQIIVNTIFILALTITAFGQNNGTVFHQVKQGETLYSISRTYSVSVDEIKQWNQLSSNNISVGQTLTIGSSASSPSDDESGKQLKRYSGTLENGNATYQYYENENYERIFHGTFEFKQKNYFKEITITGRYKDNKKDGKWTAILIDHKDWTDTRGYEIKEVATGTYSNGKLEGLCTYTKTNITNNIALAKSSVTFENNIPIGEYKYWVKDDENDLSVDLPLNAKGFANGTVTIKYNYYGNQFEHIRKYKDGYMTFELHRDMATGEIKSKFDNAQFIDENDTIYQRTEITGDYGSFWDLYAAIDFWQNGNCQYCGSRDNPLFFYDKGADVVEFKPIKQ